MKGPMTMDFIEKFETINRASYYWFLGQNQPYSLNDSYNIYIYIYIYIYKLTTVVVGDQRVPFQ